MGKLPHKTMAADGEDFARRKPLYGKVYHLSKNGNELEEIVPCLVKGLRKEIATRPLHALRDISSALAGLDERVRNGSELFSNDPNYMAAAFGQELDVICAKYNQHDSTRHLRDAADRLTEGIIQKKLGNQVEGKPQQFGELIVHDLCKQLAIEPMKEYHAFHRGLTPAEARDDVAKMMSLAASDLGQLAKDAWDSPSARRPKVDDKVKIDHSPEGLESEDLSQ